MKKKRIMRAAMLGPKDLAKLDEVRQRGYALIAVAFVTWHTPTLREDSVKQLEQISSKAAEKGLGVRVLTGYQRYCTDALTKHPNWRMRFNDGSYGVEACPFNDESKRLFIETIKRIATVRNIFEIQLNDEAHLTNWSDKWGCYCDGCKKRFREETGFEPPAVPDWTSKAWKRWIKWRLENWAAVHREFREAIKSVNPEINVSIQLTPFVDFYPWNPWFSGVDLAAIADDMDMLSTDPYHTYHLHDFRPDITYVTEFSKFYKGLMGGKPFHIWLWGIVRPGNTRELTWKDGQWCGILPNAIGAFSTQAYHFEGMKRREKLLRAYEDTFVLDPIFETVEPLKHIAIVHGFQTEIWVDNENYNLQLCHSTYDQQIFRETCKFLRRNLILYDHITDKRLKLRYIDGYKAIVLPRIACMSNDQARAIKECVEKGIGVLATYDTSLYDGEGNRRKDLALRDTLKASLKGEPPLRTCKLKVLEPSHPVFRNVDTGIIDYQAEALRVEAIQDGKILATWIDETGKDTELPAVIVSDAEGRTFYLTANYWSKIGRGYTSATKALDTMLLNAVKWVAVNEPEVHICNAPQTMEIFPSKGEDRYLATIASYMGDQATVTLMVRKPSGKRCSFAEDLVNREFYEAKESSEHLEFQVPFTRKDATKVILIKFT